MLSTKAVAVYCGWKHFPLCWVARYLHLIEKKLDRGSSVKPKLATLVTPDIFTRLRRGQLCPEMCVCELLLSHTIKFNNIRPSAPQQVD